MSSIEIVEVAPSTTHKCSSCARSYGMMRRKHSCDRCGQSSCKRCLLNSPRTTVGTNGVMPQMCANCNALVCVPAMRVRDLQRAPRNQLMQYLRLMRVDFGETVNATEIVRLVINTRDAQNGTAAPTARNTSDSSADGTRSGSSTPGGEQAATPAGTTSAASTPSATLSRRSRAAGSGRGSTATGFGSRRIRSRRRGGGTPTRTPPNGPDAPGANVDNMRSLLLTEHLLTQLFSILEDGGRGRNQSDAEYQAEQQNLREQHQILQQQQQAVHKFADVKSIDELDSFRVAELKAVLTANCIEHNQCVEKPELVTLAGKLWTSRQNAEEGGVEANLCKICYDKTSDCVFLECGHLVTCTDCGVQLKECPMCRREITRVVHVFRN